MKNLSLLIVLFISFKTFSQSPVSPNLTIGAGKVLFEKGQLDSELIAEIVSTKQDEVKTQLTKNLINKYLSNSNLALKTFVANNLDLLFSESSKDIKKKELLKNSAELAVTMGFAEYFLGDLSNRTNQFFKEQRNYDLKLDKDFKSEIIKREELEFLFEYMRNLSLDSRVIFFHYFFGSMDIKIDKSGNLNDQRYDQFILSVENHQNDLSNITDLKESVRFKKDKEFYDSLSLRSKIYFSSSYYSVKGFSKYDPRLFTQNPEKIKKTNTEKNAFKFISSQSSDNDQYKYLIKPNLLSIFKNEQDFASEKSGDFTSPNHIYIDLVYETLRSNEKIKQLGFFQRERNESHANSRYMFLKSVKSHTFKEYFEPLEQIISNKIDVLIIYYELAQTVLHEVKTNPDIVKMYKQGIEKDKTLQLTKELNLLKEKIITANSDVQIPDQEKAFLKELMQNLSQIEYETSVLNNYVNYFRSAVIPTITSFRFSNNAYREILIQADSVYTGLRQVGISRTFELVGISDNDFSTEYISNVCKIDSAMESFKPYLTLLQYLGSLDQATTYDRIFKFIADLGDIANNQESQKIINTMVNYFDKYALVNEESNSIQVDLEGITSELYSRYQENLNSRFSLMFTVGINTATPWVKDSQLSFLKDSTGISPSSASFVSEKIGFRFNVFDFARKSSTKGGAYTPILNDIHILGYFSGLLYQIDALNSVNGFDKTTFGLGIGTTFFNDLSFNLSYAGAVSSWNKSNYINIGFDIHITEYLNQLNKRRKEKKLAK
ncbi:hypothetical protein SAMN05661096_00307 [Marivirga sericea]|uniref:Uncharacterized protein n=1 Tax=Marivirga sericea TaxID=1028 RepID=A0A1X7I878_9BACT|nr:hypothetical protein [Marivirga sericea]SMG10306.1 hypothetical protein SAMN05661096_00307 [Marivirga sericea]